MDVRELAVPPSASGLPWLGQLLPFLTDPLSTLRSMADECGPVCRFRLGPQRALLVSRAEDVEQVLLDRDQSFGRSGIVRSLLGSLIGDATSMLEGDVWVRHRQQVMPAFASGKLPTYLVDTLEVVREQIPSWEAAPMIDLERAGMRLWIAVLGRVLSGRDLSLDVETVLPVMREALDGVGTALKFGAPFPTWMPLPHLRAMRRGRRQLAALGDQLMREQRTSGRRSDRLSDLLAENPNDPTAALRARDDLAGNLMIGGHQMMTAFCWTLSLLSGDASLQDELRMQLRRGSGDAKALAENALLNATVRESLRLYPPFYLVPRVTSRQVEIAGFGVAAGTMVVTSPWLTQRMPEYFVEPTKFRPERWLDAAKDLPRFAYFPFGGGPRGCVAARILPPMLAVATASLIRNHRIVRVGQDPIEPKARLSLSLSRPLAIRLVPTD